MSEIITIQLPGETSVKLPSGSNAIDAYKASGADIPKAALFALSNGELIELNREINEDASVKLLTGEDELAIDAYRHTASHVMAQAVQRLYQGTRLAIGPSIQDGFYYDFATPEPLGPEALPEIEAEMSRIIKENLPIYRRRLTKEETLELFRSRGEDYKVEMIGEIEEEELTVYEQGEFVDLCRGPHLTSTGKLKAFKLLSVAGAYWKGDETREMLQRIYATAFPGKEELAHYLEMRAEAEKRDHRKLGHELELFSIREEVGPGLVIWHPNGAVVRNEIESFLKREHLKRGYQPVISPHIMKQDVWKTSGHYDMQYPMYFFEIEGADYGIKPMNCPAHIYIYKSRTRGHHELPIRFFELGTVYRHERSGVLHGLLRVRGFTQDDAHIFCTLEQADKEINDALSFAFEMQRTFGFSTFRIALSTRPEHSVGLDSNWEFATEALKSALERQGLDYVVEDGEGVFYGPKIDVKLKDALGRWWQGPTIQFDFNLPTRFDMAYVGADNKEHAPVMIHRTVLGSVERYMGILIEQYAGAFPLWLAPLQLEILPIADRHIQYATDLATLMLSRGIRVRVNTDRETTGNKIRKAWRMKVPYMCIIGDNEVEEGNLSVRSLSGEDLRGVETSRFIEGLLTEIADKRIREA